jgi:hypothetical protein
MIRIRTATRILWGGNALLAAALLAWVECFFVAPPQAAPLSDLDFSAATRASRPGPGALPGEEAMAAFPNPLGPRTATPEAAPPLRLSGTLPARRGEGGFAFVRVGGRETLAARGDEIHGWRLIDLWKDRAAFISPDGQRSELVIEPWDPPATHR